MKYILVKNGEEVFRGTEWEIVAYLHKAHPYSVDYALKYAGYKVEVSV